MAKPRKRPTLVNSDYFDGVTPLWHGPKNTPVPPQYIDACNTLADWAGPEWPDNDATGFFSLRHYFIDACEKWNAFNWEADKQLIVAHRKDERHRDTLLRATKAFRLALRKSAFRRAERDVGLEIALALCPECQCDLTYEQGCEAVSQALQRFEDMNARRDFGKCRFGPLWYETFPQRLPKRETALAIVLADLFTELRRDEHRSSRRLPFRFPLISEGTPWKAIAEFVTACSDDAEAKITPEKIQFLVNRHLPKVKVIRLFP